MAQTIKPASFSPDKIDQANQWVHDLRNVVWAISTSAEIADNALSKGQSADVQSAMKRIERNSAKCMELLQKTPFD